MKFVLMRESEIFISCKLNFNLPTGYDVLTSLLKMSNDTYNFDPLLTIVDHLAIDYIFLDPPQFSLDTLFKISPPSQSKVYSACLHAVCSFLQWGDFAKSFSEFVENEGIPLDMDLTRNFEGILNCQKNDIDLRVQSICLEHKLFVPQIMGNNVP